MKSIAKDKLKKMTIICLLNSDFAGTMYEQVEFPHISKFTGGISSCSVQKKGIRFNINFNTYK